MYSTCKWLLLLLLPIPAMAQYVTITGTVLDPNGCPYVNGTGRAVLVPQNVQYYFGNNPVRTVQVVVQLSSTGTFSIQLNETDLLSPTSPTPQWQFSFNSSPVVSPIATGPVTFTMQPLTLTSSQDISTLITAQASPMPAGCGSTSTQPSTTCTSPVVGAVINSSGGATPALQCDPLFTDINGLVAALQYNALEPWNGELAMTALNTGPPHALPASTVSWVAPNIIPTPIRNVMPGALGSTGQGLQLLSITTDGSGTKNQVWGYGNFAGTGAPGGANTQVQYNNSGAFGGIANVVPGSVLASTGTNVTPTFQTKTYIDVRDGYNGSGGVDCTGVTDSTAALQAMINNAPDFSQFKFPENCKILVSTTSGSPKAITIQSRYGLEFWAQGRNTNACDTGSSGPGGMRIIDNSTYVSGATIFYINQSQRLLFHNLVVDIGGATDIGFDVDQTTSPPITTQNIWENVCVRNNVARNANFRGWRFSNTATSNVESQWLISPYVQCSSQTATSQSSNGYGILFGNNINQKNEIVDKLGTFGCSVDVNAQNGTDFTFSNWLMSNSYTNLIDGTSNSLLSGIRTENATSSIQITNINSQHTITHNDLAATTTPINCNPNGCGSIFVNNVNLDTLGDLFNPAPNGENSTLVGFNNRNTTYNQYDFEFGMFTAPVTGDCNFCWITNTFGEYLTSPLRATPTSGTNNNNQSPVTIWEGVYGASNTLDTWASQSIPNGAYGNITNSTWTLEPVSYVAGFMPPSGITRWLAIPAQQSGLTLATIPTPSAPVLKNGGVAGSSSYTYEIVAHGMNGTTVAGSTATIPNGPSPLTGANYILIAWASVPGATSYDIYRTACGGAGICGTNPTGKIISHSGVVLEHWLVSQASAITVQDTGLAGDATTAPTINTTGSLLMTNCAAAGTAANPSVASCGGANSGAVSCATNASTGTCTVNTTLVTANSDIFIQQRTDTATGTRIGSTTCNTTKDSNSTAPQVTAISAGVSFTFQLGTFSTNPECFNYFFVN